MRMQQEAGESRRRGRTDAWQRMQGNLVAEPCHGRAELRVQQNVPWLLPAMARDLLERIPCPSPFSGCFSSFPHLLVLVSLCSDNLLLLWQKSVGWVPTFQLSTRATPDLLEHNRNKIWKRKLQKINLKFALSSILDIATSKSSALCSHLIFFYAISASLRGFLLGVKGTEWASRWLQPVSVLQQLNDALGSCILPLAEL